MDASDTDGGDKTVSPAKMVFAADNYAAAQGTAVVSGVRTMTVLVTEGEPSEEYRVTLRTTPTTVPGGMVMGTRMPI